MRNQRQKTQSSYIPLEDRGGDGKDLTEEEEHTVQSYRSEAVPEEDTEEKDPRDAKEIVANTTTAAPAAATEGNADIILILHKNGERSSFFFSFAQQGKM